MKTQDKVHALRIGEKHFRTKAACKDFFKAMLARYAPGQRVTQEDFALLHALLEHHSEAEQKIGCGVVAFVVERDPVWVKNKYFRLVRRDGSTADFSYLKCISPARDQHQKDVLSALRSDIHPQIRAFRERAYSGRECVRCGITGLDVQKADSHRDHVHPATFQRLAHDWMAAARLSPADVVVADVSGPDVVTGLTLASPLLRQSWQDHHQQHAVLRIVERHAHLALKKK